MMKKKSLAMCVFAVVAFVHFIVTNVMLQTIYILNANIKLEIKNKRKNKMQKTKTSCINHKRNKAKKKKKKKHSPNKIQVIEAVKES